MRGDKVVADNIQGVDASTANFDKLPVAPDKINNFSTPVLFKTVGYGTWKLALEVLQLGDERAGLESTTVLLSNAAAEETR